MQVSMGALVKFTTRVKEMVGKVADDYFESDEGDATGLAGGLAFYLQQVVDQLTHVVDAEQKDEMHDTLAQRVAYAEQMVAGWISEFDNRPDEDEGDEPDSDESEA